MYEIEVNYGGFTGSAGGPSNVQRLLSGSLESLKEYVEVLSGQINHEITGLEAGISEILSGIFNYVPAAAQSEIFDAFTSTELYFCCDLLSGHDSHYVQFPTGMVCAPDAIVPSLNNEKDDYVYDFKVRDISSSGFQIIFSENLYSTYELCVYAKVAYLNMLNSNSSNDLDKY